MDYILSFKDDDKETTCTIPGIPLYQITKNPKKVMSSSVVGCLEKEFNFNGVTRVRTVKGIRIDYYELGYLKAQHEGMADYPIRLRYEKIHDESLELIKGSVMEGALHESECLFAKESNISAKDLAHSCELLKFKTDADFLKFEDSICQALNITRSKLAGLVASDDVMPLMPENPSTFLVNLYMAKCVAKYIKQSHLLFDPDEYSRVSETYPIPSSFVMRNSKELLKIRSLINSYVFQDNKEALCLNNEYIERIKNAIKRFEETHGAALDLNKLKAELTKERKFDKENQLYGMVQNLVNDERNLKVISHNPTIGLSGSEFSKLYDENQAQAMFSPLSKEELIKQFKDTCSVAAEMGGFYGAKEFAPDALPLSSLANELMFDVFLQKDELHSNSHIESIKDLLAAPLGKKPLFVRVSNATGAMILEAVSSNGKLNGPCYTYYKDGRMRRRSFYHNDKMTNFFVQFYASGQVQTEGFYKEDMQNGAFRKYARNGELIRIDFYHRGILQNCYHKAPTKEPALKDDAQKTNS